MFDEFLILHEYTVLKVIVLCISIAYKDSKIKRTSKLFGHFISVASLFDVFAQEVFGVAGADDAGGLTDGVALEGSVGVGAANDAVGVFHHEVLSELLPGVEGALGSHVGVVGQQGLGLVRVGLPELKGGGLDAGLGLVEGCLKLGLGGTEVADEEVVAGIDHVGDPIEYPEGGAPGEGDVVGAVNTGVALGHAVGAAVDRGEDGHVGVVSAEPEYSAHGVGQVGTHLGDEDEAGLLGGDGAFVEVLLAVDLEVEGREAVGCVVGAGAEVLADVEGSSFVMVAHGVLDVLDGEFAVGLEVKGHGSGVFTLDVGQELLSAVGEEVVVAPDTSLAVAQFAKARDDVGRVEAVVLVVEGELMDAAVVGMGGDAVVGHAHGHPDGSAHAGAFAYHLHNPHFVGIGDGEGLTAAVIAVFLHQLGHDLDGLAGVARALEGEVDEAAIVDDAQRVNQLGASAEGGLADGQLEFVHVADDAVRLAGLFNLAQVLACVPLVDVNHRPLRIDPGGIVVQLAEQPVGVGRIRHDGGAVRRSVLAHNQVGAGGGVRGHGRRQQDG